MKQLKTNKLKLSTLILLLLFIAIILTILLHPNKSYPSNSIVSTNMLEDIKQEKFKEEDNQTQEVKATLKDSMVNKFPENYSFKVVDFDQEPNQEEYEKESEEEYIKQPTKESYSYKDSDYEYTIIKDSDKFYLLNKSQWVQLSPIPDFDLNKLIETLGSNNTAEIFGSDIFLSKLNYYGKVDCEEKTKCNLFIYDKQNFMMFNKEGLLVRMERYDENLEKILSFTEIKFNNIQIEEPKDVKVLNETESLEFISNL